MWIISYTYKNMSVWKYTVNRISESKDMVIYHFSRYWQIILQRVLSNLRVKRSACGIYSETMGVNWDCHRQTVMYGLPVHMCSTNLHTTRKMWQCLFLYNFSTPCEVAYLSIKKCQQAYVMLFCLKKKEMSTEQFRYTKRPDITWVNQTSLLSQ